jgi:uncharacterized protein YjdB
MTHVSQKPFVRAVLALSTLVGGLGCGASEVTAACTVSAVRVVTPVMDFAIGQTAQANAQYTVQNCSPVPTIAWSSNNTAVATISATGLITARAAGGPVSIQATVGAQTGSTTITVVPIR